MDPREAERVVEIEEASLGLEAAIVVDRLVDGQAAGGIRRAPYPSFDAARREAHALARAMSIKCALADLPAGGAKTVIRQTPGLDTEAAYRRVGEAVEAMDGTYLCGPDVGTGQAELDLVRSVTDHVNPRGNDPARATARGVVAGIRGLLAGIGDAAGIDGSRFVVQGYGNVGADVARRLARAGGQVLVAEVDPDAQADAREAGHQVIEPEQATQTVCDVFVPCALGGVLTPVLARSIPARGICGSANEQLASQVAARILHERGVAYAPDVLVNAGAVIEGVLTARSGRTEPVLAEVAKRIDGIEHRVREVLSASRREDRSPHAIVLDDLDDTLAPGP